MGSHIRGMTLGSEFGTSRREARLLAFLRSSRDDVYQRLSGFGIRGGRPSSKITDWSSSPRREGWKVDIVCACSAATGSLTGWRVVPAQCARGSVGLRKERREVCMRSSCDDAEETGLKCRRGETRHGKIEPFVRDDMAVPGRARSSGCCPWEYIRRVQPGNGVLYIEPWLENTENRR